MGLMFGQNERWIAKFVSKELKKKIRKEWYSFVCSCKKHKIDLVNKLKSFGNVPYIAGGRGGRGSTMVKVLYYKSEGRWFDPSWFQWIFL